MVGLVAVMVVGVFAIVGCGSEEEIDNNGDVAEGVHPALADVVKGDGRTITVATEPTYPPFESMVGGEVVGFDIDLTRAIAHYLGAEIEFTFLGWDALLTALGSDSRDFDFAASAMTITPERAEVILFSDPYFVSYQALAVPADSDITSVDDLGPDTSVAVQSGTTGHIFATANLEEKGVNIRPYPGGQDCFLAMASGEVDGVIIDIPVASNQAQDGDFDIRIIPIESADQERFGFAFGKSRTELAEAVNQALAALIEDGTYAEIYAKWINPDSDPVLP